MTERLKRLAGDISAMTISARGEDLSLVSQRLLAVLLDIANIASMVASTRKDATDEEGRYRDAQNGPKRRRVA